MDKKKIERLCEQILLGANSVSVTGEQNMAQLMGICRSARLIASEINKPERQEVEQDG